MKKRSKTTRSKHVRTRGEISAGAVVFYIEQKAIKVLLLLQNKEKEVLDIGPKGKVKPGESLAGAAYRELREEIGLPLHLDTNFAETEQYAFFAEDSKHVRTRVTKKVVYFLAQLHRNDIRQIVLSDEHTKYYLLPIDEAINRAKFAIQKQLLKNAKGYITANYLT